MTQLPVFYCKQLFQQIKRLFYSLRVYVSILHNLHSSHTALYSTTAQHLYTCTLLCVLGSCMMVEEAHALMGLELVILYPHSPSLYVLLATQ